jgi:hypothetical protein
MTRARPPTPERIAETARRLLGAWQAAGLAPAVVECAPDGTIRILASGGKPAPDDPFDLVDLRR